MNHIYFVGYDGIHKDDFYYDVPEGFDSYLLILTTTPAVFRINGVLKEYPAHTAILYPPNHEIYYGAAGQTYGNNWLRFISDESYIANFPQMAVPFSVSDPEYCHNLFQLLTWETSQLTGSAEIYHNISFIAPNTDASTDSKQHDLIISHLLRILFQKLAENIADTETTSHDYELLALRRQISNNPQFPWNIADMAEQLHVSSGYLQLLYKKKFTVSCMDDVIHFRLIKAQDLLVYTKQSVSEIAEHCGYNHTEHFCRQFYKFSGSTPGQYRKDMTQKKDC